MGMQADASMTSEPIWVLKVIVKIFVVAFVGIMLFRTWYWADNCVFNKTYVYPPVYQCGIHPFDFADNYIEMRMHNQEMSKRIKAEANVGNFPPIDRN